MMGWRSSSGCAAQWISNLEPTSVAILAKTLNRTRQAIMPLAGESVRNLVLPVC